MHDAESYDDLISLEEALRGGRAPETPSREFAFTRADLLKVTPPDWLIEGIIEKNTLAAVFGDPGAGKSFLALSMAAAIATGTAWHGHKCASGAVFVVA